MLDHAELNTQDKAAVRVMVFAKGDQLGVFDFDNAGSTVKIGMEICVDHFSGVLSKGGAKDLDRQIVLAASTSMKENFAVVRDGGCVFLCSANSTTVDARQRAWQRVKGDMVDLRDGTGLLREQSGSVHFCETTIP